MASISFEYGCAWRGGFPNDDFGCRNEPKTHYKTFLHPKQNIENELNGKLVLAQCQAKSAIHK